MFVSLRGVSTQLFLTTTYIGHHQVVHSLILKQTIQYAMFFMMADIGAEICRC